MAAAKEAVDSVAAGSVEADLAVGGWVVDAEMAAGGLEAAGLAEEATAAEVG